MPTNSLRPSISETSYRFFDRPLHPELFAPVIVGHVNTTRYGMTLGICHGGHFLKFTADGEACVEVTGPADQELSRIGLQQSDLFGEIDELVAESHTPFAYHFSGQVDVVDPAVFTRVQMELELEAKQAFLSHQFSRRNRLFPGPLSIAKVEGTTNSLTVHTFHTFPRDNAVLRTQSLFELERE